MATVKESQIVAAPEGKKKEVTCSAWIRRKEGKNNSDNKLLVVMGRSATAASPALLELYTFDPKTSSLSSDPWKFVIGEEGANPTGFAVHPSGDEFVCATTKGCKLYKLVPQEFAYHLIAKDEPRLESVGRQKCLAFSTDGSKLAIGGEDGHLWVFHWPSLDTLIDEPKAHKSFKDMDISLDSELLVSTSIDGSARLWKLTDGTPLMNLDRSAEEKIQCCRFSRDGMKPFLFCTVEKSGGNVVTVVWDMATWKRLGFKRLLRKPISVLSVSLDGKYLALGSNDGDFCVVNVKKMEVQHWSRKVHLGASVSAIHFCPTERVVISNSDKWGAEVTKLTVPGDWKVWQAMLVLLGLFFVSALAMYFFYRTSDSFWNFPMGKNQLPAWKLQEQSHIQGSGSMFIDDSEFPDEL
ncbi:SEC12-like protein 1 [Rhynchospora pubera]|uniref:SEC12-like protein 1 n=1 Tax=Rhynchospora pubera TaxID=906938 RepID=A0AAV8H562_9POAL|nr:SEC12-like protein 1 [Rhynchospora pubera]